ncbi:MAG: ABC transporter permease, partial [Hyphomicrobiales bacterium]
MRALDKKLLRDLGRLWAQGLAIAMVIAAGVATLILGAGAQRALDETRQAYYERYRFADVFATLKRAPDALVDRIREIPGVAAAETRVVKPVLLDIEGMPQPATALAMSLPDHRAELLNRLYLRMGRTPEPDNASEVVVNEAFAKAHGFAPGDRFGALLNGRKRQLTIVGVALSPEFIYALGPGDLMPDDKRFGLLWMSHSALASVFDLEGAFNNVAVKLLRGAPEADVIQRLDALIERYGGTGSHGRKDQQSHAFIDAELDQLKAMSRVIPPIFLLVSAFLINITLSRMIALEREQIGLMKAIGYGKFAIAMHYIKLTLAIALVGVIIGSAAGTWLGQGLTRLYADFFHFPFLLFDRDIGVYAVAAGISFLAAGAGGARAVASVLNLPPAVAMSPPVPVQYGQGWIKAITPVLRQFSHLTAMAVRHSLRWPLRTAFTMLGISLSCAVLITALFITDSVETMIDTIFVQTERQDATIAFTDERA